MKIKSISWTGGPYFNGEGCTIPLEKDIIVLVGKNNCGKSRIVEYLVSLGQAKMISSTFCVSIQGDEFVTGYLEIIQESIRTHFENVLEPLRGSAFTLSIHVNEELKRGGINYDPILRSQVESMPLGNHSYFYNFINENWNGYHEELQEIVESERDVTPEDVNLRITMDSKGVGLTSEIHSLYMDQNREDTILSEDIRKFINEVLQSEDPLIQIVTKRLKIHPYNHEIYFRTEKKGLVPLSKSGSSIKSLLLISIKLFFLIQRPAQVSDHPDKNFRKVIYIEEPENNIHAYALRRLLGKLEAMCKVFNIQLILTTHSNVTIDFFAGNERAAIVHVEHDGTNISAKPIEHLDEIVEVIQALGCKASDLLQANGVIWVEGPSDRIYVKRWIDLFSDGKWVEGRHYQIAFFGGSLNTHLKADNEPADDSLINLLSINQNAFFICDSDLEDAADTLKKPVARITDELKKSSRHGYWITAKREIESYIPVEVLQAERKLSEPPRSIGQYENFHHAKRDGAICYWEEVSTNTGFDKVPYALKFAKLMTKENMVEQDDWKDKMDTLVKTIRAWNEETNPE